MPFIPTLIIGAGGTGSRIVSKVRKMVLENERYKDFDDNVFIFCAIDTDSGDMSKLDIIPQNKITLSSSISNINSYIDELKRDFNAQEELDNLKKWFYMESRAFLNHDLTRGAGQFRMLSYAAWYIALKRTNLETRLTRVFEKLLRTESHLNYQAENPMIDVYIVSSIAGGTGSGIALSVGRQVRKFYSNKNVRCYIKGVLLLPHIFCHSPQGPAFYPRLKANGYSFLKELEAFFKRYDKNISGEKISILLSDFPVDCPPGEYFPFDTAFIIDKGSQGRELQYIGGDYSSYENFVAQALYCRIFSKQLADKASSAENNNISDLIMNQENPLEPTRRFCSLGTAAIIYSKEDALDYHTKKLMIQLISGEWKIIDESYQRYLEEYNRLRSQGRTDVKIPYRYQYFIDTINTKAQEPDCSNFIKKIYNDNVKKTEDGTIIKLYEEFIESLNNYIDETIKNLANSRELAGFQKGITKDLLIQCSYGGKSSLINEIRKRQRNIKDYEQVLKEKSSFIQSQILEEVLLTYKKEGEYKNYQIYKYINNLPIFSLRYFISNVFSILNDELDEINKKFIEYSKRKNDIQNKDWNIDPDRKDKIDVEDFLYQYLPEDYNFFHKLFNTKKYRAFDNFFDEYVDYYTKSIDYINLYYKTSIRFNVYKRLCNFLGEQLNTGGMLGLIYKAIDKLIKNKENYESDLKNIGNSNRLALSKYQNITFVYSSSECKEEQWKMISNYIEQDYSFRNKAYENITEGFINSWYEIINFIVNKGESSSSSIIRYIEDVAEKVGNNIEDQFFNFFSSYLSGLPEIDLNIIEAIEKEINLKEGNFDSNYIKNRTIEIFNKTIENAVPFINIDSSVNYRTLDFIIYDRRLGDVYTSILKEITRRTFVDPSTVSDDFYGKNVLIFTRAIYGIPINRPIGIVRGDDSLAKAYFEELSKNEGKDINEITPIHIDKRYIALIEEIDPEINIEILFHFANALILQIIKFDNINNKYFYEDVIENKYFENNQLYELFKEFRENYFTKFRTKIVREIQKEISEDKRLPDSQKNYPKKLMNFILKYIKREYTEELTENDKEFILILIKIVTKKLYENEYNRKILREEILKVRNDINLEDLLKI